MSKVSYATRLFTHLEQSKPDSPVGLRQRVDVLKGSQRAATQQVQADENRLASQREYLALAPHVEAALDQLSHSMFLDLLRILQEQLTTALQEVLEQPISLRAEPDFKRGSATVEFWIERSGEREDIMRGQGGSAANVLSVGLRMFALARLNPSKHRSFLVLDEPDCWLRPELVPKVVKIIHEAGKTLGFQVLLISHHDVELFEEYADKMYRFEPQPDGSVKVSAWSNRAATVDAEEEPPLSAVVSPDLFGEMAIS